MNLVVFSIFLTLFSISNGRSALDKRYRFDYIEEVEDPEIEFINETLRDFNKIRRRYAIDERVPNVWKLRNQKEIGCGKYKCRGWKVLQISLRNHGETNNFDEICLIGPETEFIWPQKHVNGTPGSGCAKEGGKGFNKLCIPESVDLEDYTTPIPVSEVSFEYSSASFRLCELWLIVLLISLVSIK
ncbi:hypothetical protein B9Z55_021468 [Caenorhabditis nigoni]|uniref:Uncharacterized protein n=1 Tax=Caenorhabditis nigoni TaxID=1611254 RepID=A0A2G5TT08_9PELO|nr:hypothetical protein B9Z55_021468 [Caenorhabditis nigoni]